MPQLSIRVRLALILIVVALVTIQTACGGTSLSETNPAAPEPATVAPPVSAPLPPLSGNPSPAFTTATANVLVGAGDIDDCTDGARQTAALLDTIPGTVYTTGDNAYDHGSLEDYLRCYDANWGRHKARTRPTPGNHEYHTPGAAGYFQYFGPQAGPPGLGYYSFHIGEWLVLALNSEVDAGIGSEQLRWVRQTLEQERSRCIVAYWHQPHVSSGPSRGSSRMREVWKALMEHRAEVVLAGHDHFYERFAPVDAFGRRDPAGIRSFIVGTGGSRLMSATQPHPASAFRGRIHGVLKLTLGAGRYDWEFVSVQGPAFTDVGSDSCQ